MVFTGLEDVHNVHEEGVDANANLLFHVNVLYKALPREVLVCDTQIGLAMMESLVASYQGRAAAEEYGGIYRGEVERWLDLACCVESATRSLKGRKGRRHGSSAFGGIHEFTPQRLKGLMAAKVAYSYS
jgi:hypothetical protein